MRSFVPATTSLSGRVGVRARCSALPLLARTWLVTFAAAMLLLGCLFPEPPPYRREKTPPILWAPDPPVTKLLKFKPADPQVFPFPITVKLRSEDDGEAVLAHLFLNYQVSDPKVTPTFQTYDRAEAASLEEERLLDLRWSPSLAAGTCQPLSLLVAHESTFDQKTKLPLKTDSDLQVLTWWVAFVEDLVESPVNCPRVTVGAPQ